MGYPAGDSQPAPQSTWTVRALLGADALPALSTATMVTVLARSFGPVLAPSEILVSESKLSGHDERLERGRSRSEIGPRTGEREGRQRPGRELGGHPPGRRRRRSARRAGAARSSRPGLWPTTMTRDTSSATLAQPFEQPAARRRVEPVLDPRFGPGGQGVGDAVECHRRAPGRRAQDQLGRLLRAVGEVAAEAPHRLLPSRGERAGVVIETRVGPARLGVTEQVQPAQWRALTIP